MSRKDGFWGDATVVKYVPTVLHLVLVYVLYAFAKLVSSGE